jgi:hypothetical protein
MSLFQPRRETRPDETASAASARDDQQGNTPADTRTEAPEKTAVARVENVVPARSGSVTTESAETGAHPSGRDQLELGIDGVATRTVTCETCANALTVDLAPGKTRHYCDHCGTEFFMTVRGRAVSLLFNHLAMLTVGRDCRRASVVSLDEALALFGATRETDWETIEMTRRKLVRQYHPYLLADANDCLLEKVRNNRRLVGSAFDLLVESRLAPE